MKNTLVNIFAALSVPLFSLVWTATAQAKPTNYVTSSYYSSGYQNEFQTGFNSGVFSSSKSGDYTLTNLNIYGSYSRVIQDQIQAGGELHIYNSSGGPRGNSFFEGFGFGTYNFTSDLKNAFYGKAGLGTFALLNKKGEYENKIGFVFGIGKRFSLWDRIQYNPEFRFYFKGDEGMTYAFHFLNISIMF